jgi:uncharacterized cysteine cluster protein YcgN (CxxCxxCC family)
MSAPFWKTTPLEAMTESQWESLCDGCGKCCAFTLEDEETGEMFRTRVACRLFDAAACGCGDYANRFTRVAQCIKVTPDNVRTLTFFPATCAYRLVALGSDLPDWHHLVCGDREEIHRRGKSIRGQTISETEVDDDDFEDHILDEV